MATLPQHSEVVSTQTSTKVRKKEFTKSDFQFHGVTLSEDKYLSIRTEHRHANMNVLICS